MRSSRRIVLALALTLGPAAIALAAPPLARADEGAPAPSTAIPSDLMSGLAQHAVHFEEMKKRGAFTFSGRMEEIDGEGKATDPKEIVVRSTPTSTPGDRISKVIKCTESGKDTTAEAQKKADEKRAKRLKEPAGEDRGKQLKLPFLPTEQARYVFTMGEHDPANPSRVRILFTPRAPAEDAIKGSAWVDEKEREVLSMGFSFSKNPMFIDHVEVKIVFGMPTQLGRAPSNLSFDGRGGFLFIRKHYRGTATISDAAVVL